MNVLIVGGGISGLAHAAFLEGSDVSYEIVEKCPDWSHQGYLIGLWDNGRDILRKLGLAEKLDTVGSRVRHNSTRDGSGREIRNFNMSSLYSEFGGSVTIIGRKELHSWLLDKVNQSKNTMNRTVTAIRCSASGCDITFSDGVRKSYDIVVGADGVHSTVRSLVFGKNTEQFTNWRAWYVWIDNAYDTPASIVEYIEPREFITTFSSGGKTLATLIASADHREWDTQQDRIERLKRLFQDETYIVPAALEKLKDDEALPTDLADVNLSHTVSDRVALIGDAAHCLGPMAGLGTSMALEDAYTLAAELMKVSDTHRLLTALSMYEQSRRLRRAIARRLNKRIRMASLVRSPILFKVIMFAARYIPEWVLARDYKKLLRNEI